MRGQLLDKLERYARDNERAYHRAVREIRAYRKAQPVENKPQPVRPAAERNEANPPAPTTPPLAFAVAAPPFLPSEPAHEYYADNHGDEPRP